MFSLIFVPVSDYRWFSGTINISQGSRVAHLRYGGLFSHHFATNSLVSVLMKEFSQSVTQYLIFDSITAMNCVSYFFALSVICILFMFVANDIITLTSIGHNFCSR